METSGLRCQFPAQAHSPSRTGPLERSQSTREQPAAIHSADIRQESQKKHEIEHSGCRNGQGQGSGPADPGANTIKESCFSSSLGTPGIDSTRAYQPQARIIRSVEIIPVVVSQKCRTPFPLQTMHPAQPAIRCPRAFLCHSPIHVP